MSLIRTATDLLAIGAQGRRMTNAPKRFDGTLDELFEGYIAQNVLSAESVADFHRRLVEYVNSADPLFLIRAIGDTERRQIYVTGDGTRFKATDNAPAWWIHSALFQKVSFEAATFPTVIETIPAHFHDVVRYRNTANASGWHFAHIFDVKNRNTDYPSWRRRDVIAGFIRSVHPCNYFLVPKPEWQRWGGDERVIGYFGALHAERYADVWKEFVSLARADVGRLARTSGVIRYAISERAPQTVQLVQETPARPKPVINDNERSPRASYSATRLTFKAAVIERLGDDDKFRVVIPDGVIEMTKRQFKEKFPNVTRSASYREQGYYNYPKLPRVAMQFLKAAAKSQEATD